MSSRLSCKQVDADQLTEADVRRYFDRLLRLGLTKRSQANRYGLLRTFFRFAGLDPKRLVASDLHKDLKAFPKPEPVAYSAAEIGQLLRACKREYHALIFEFLLKSGLRHKE